MGVEWGRPPGGTHSQSATAPRSSATHRYLPIPTKHTAKRRLGRCSQNRSETEPGHVPRASPLLGLSLGRLHGKKTGRSPSGISFTQ